MKRAILIGAVASALCGVLAAADPNTAREVLTLEKQALDGWQKGDSSPLLATLDPNITYIHVMTDGRLEGLPAVKALFDGYRGRPLFDSYEIVDPRVQVSGDIAILTYQLAVRNGDTSTRWNGTQVYEKKKEGWRVIHTHWSRQPAP